MQNTFIMKNYECLGLPLLAITTGVRFLREITETDWRERNSQTTHLLKFSSLHLPPPQEVVNALFCGTNLKSLVDQFSSVSVMFDSLWPHELQHTRLPCPSPTPGAYSNSCPLNWWRPSNHLILCHPLLLLPSVFPCIRVFSSESVLHIRWPKYWSFSISPSNEYSGLISFRMDWLDIFVVQGTLKSSLQHHS